MSFLRTPFGLAWAILLAFLSILLLLPAESHAQGVTNTCINNVSAQGTSDAITSVALPCATVTNLVILTAAAANTTTTPTYQPLGSPALPITTANGGSVSVGDFQPGFVALLSGTGSSWILLNPTKNDKPVCQSALEYGFIGDAITDNKNAWVTARAALPTSACLHFPSGTYFTSVGETWTLPTGVASLSIEGDGADNTILNWSSPGGGLAVTEVSCQNSFHITGLSFTSGVAAGGTALNVMQNDVNCSTYRYAQNDVMKVTFRGTDGGNATDYWNNAVVLTGVWGTNFYGDMFWGGTLAQGTGVILAGASASQYTTLVNFNSCIFLWLSESILYGSYTQGVTVEQSNFNNDAVGIGSNAGEVGTLDQLLVSTSQFNTSSDAIELSTVVYQTQLINNIFIILTGQVGVQLSPSTDPIITGNWFDGISVTGSYGLVVGAGGNGGIVTGNHFYTLGLGINMETGSLAYLISGNEFRNNSSNIVDNGTGDQIEMNVGYNPVGAAAVTPAASPWTYAASSSPETLYLSTTGAISAVTQNGVSIAPSTSTATFSPQLGPGDVLVVTYSGTMSAKKMVH